MAIYVLLIFGKCAILSKDATEICHDMNLAVAFVPRLISFFDHCCWQCRYFCSRQDDIPRSGYK